MQKVMIIALTLLVVLTMSAGFSSVNAAEVQNNNSATSQANNVNATNVVVNTGSGDAAGSASSAGEQDGVTNQENVDESGTNSSNTSNSNESVVQNNNSATAQAQNVDCTNVVVNTASGSADGTCAATGEQEAQTNQENIYDPAGNGETLNSFF